MHRCWLAADRPPEIGGLGALSRQESDRVLKALRMQAGDPVQLIAAERPYGGEIASAGGDASVEMPSPEPALKGTLVQGLPKYDKLEWIVQEATELGVYQILPAEMERSVVRIMDNDGRKRERLARIALETAKQSGRAHVPQSLPAVRFSDVLKDLKGVVYVAWEEAAVLCLSEAVAADRPQEAALVVGPEGGITAQEFAYLAAISAKPVTLGPRTLRTETAGLCALAVTPAAPGVI